MLSSILGARRTFRKLPLSFAYRMTVCQSSTVTRRRGTAGNVAGQSVRPARTDALSASRLIYPLAVESICCWNWTFWDGVLGPLSREIVAASPIAPALVNPRIDRPLVSSDPTAQAISRRGAARRLLL